MIKIILMLTLLLGINFHAQAWVPNGEVSYVKEITTYGSDARFFIIKLESGTFCYLPNIEGENKKAYETIMNMKNFSKRGSFYCYDSVELQNTGMPSHRLHRVTAL